MNSSNDLPDVAALLRELECSPAWQELKAANAAAGPVAEPTNHQPHQSRPFAAAHTDADVSMPMRTQAGLTAAQPVSTPAPAPPVSSVADLLSQLSSTAIPHQGPLTTSNNSGQYEHAQTNSRTISSASGTRRFTPRPVSATPSNERGDVQKYSFRQSLPILSELGEDAAFVSAIKKMKVDQDQLERKLWADREAIYTKYQDKIKVARTKAQLIGVEVSQHEFNMLNDAYKKEISKFDRERVLPAWDGLISRQQTELAQKAVPTMFVTNDVHDREVCPQLHTFSSILSMVLIEIFPKTQQQVVGVLESIAGPLKKP